MADPKPPAVEPEDDAAKAKFHAWLDEWVELQEKRRIEAEPPRKGILAQIFGD